MSFREKVLVNSKRLLPLTAVVVAGCLLAGKTAVGGQPNSVAWRPHCGSVTVLPAMQHAAIALALVGCAPDPVNAAGTNAAGAGTGSISGAVTEDGTGSSLAGTCVLAVEQTIGAAPIVRSDATGAYIIDALPEGSFALEFFDCAAGVSHRAEWYDGQQDFNQATVIDLAEGQAVTGINASLAVGGGTISGTVTADGTHEPLADVCVLAFDQSDEGAGTGVSDNSGAYAINGLDSGEYILEFIDCADDELHVLEWYSNEMSPRAAQKLSVSSGNKTGGINASLSVGATISGTVHDGSPSGPLLEGICAVAYDRDGFFHGSGVTDENGAYAATGLPDIDLKLLFLDCTRPYHHIARWRGGTTFEDGSVIRPGGPGAIRSGIDASLQLGGSIGGTVTDSASGAPVRDMCIEAYTPSGDFEDQRLTIGDGSYEVGGLALGQHYLLVRDCRHDPEYAWQWHSDASFFDDAETVTVTSDITALANESISRSGVFSGLVTDQTTDEGLPGICVSAIDPFQRSRGFAITDRKGRYAIALESGSRKVFFVDCSVDPVYNPEWWRNKQSFETADLFTIGGPGTAVTGRNGTLSLFLAGDVDCTRSVTAIDAALILQGVAGLLFEFECQYNADPDNDGVISAIDAALVLQFVAGLLPDL